MGKIKRLNYRKAIRLWFPVLVWTFIIFLFSSQPTGEVSEIHWKDFVVKKTAHIVEYAILSLFLYRALKGSGIAKRKAGLYSIICSILYGLSDEFHQSFTPGRDPKLRDVLFDTTGAVSAIYFIWKWLPQRQKSNKLFSMVYKFIYGDGEKE